MRGRVRDVFSRWYAKFVRGVVADAAIDGEARARGGRRVQRLSKVGARAVRARVWASAPRVCVVGGRTGVGKTRALLRFARRENR